MVKEANVRFLLNSRISRFLLVGLLNTALTYAAYALFLWLGFTYAWAIFFAIIVGVLIGFKTQGTIVFQNQDNRLFFRFAVACGVLYFVNIGLIGEFLSWGLNPYSAGVLALPLMAILSFVIQNTFVFRREGGSNTSLPRRAIKDRSDGSSSGRKGP